MSAAHSLSPNASPRSRQEAPQRHEPPVAGTEWRTGGQFGPQKGVQSFEPPVTPAA